METIDQQIELRAKAWLSNSFDADTRAEVERLMNEDPSELSESFYTDLEFGTGGMRGIMGVGTNRINRYTIGLATQGFSAYLRSTFPGERLSVAIAHDSRNNSDYFARVAAEVLSANDIEVYLFSALRPTPELSFAVRQKKCAGGIVITASHNPPEYNGFKVYWKDGGQIVAPHDQGIITQVRKTEVKDIRFDGNDQLIHIIDEEIDSAYLAQTKSLVLSPDAIDKHGDIKIVFTALHGTGITMVPRVLEEWGFTNVTLVPQQDIPDGNFPTVASPNPEETQALQRGLELCREIDADLLLGTDPDADRVGLAVKDGNGDYVLLNGNQAGSLLVYYHLLRKKENGTLRPDEFVAKTVVTTDLIEIMARDFNVHCYSTLTGFKFIAAKIQELEGKQQFITGGEESYGYLAGDFVRDKDAVISSALFAEMTAWARSRGMTLLDVLFEMYDRFGYFQEALVSITRKGRTGKEEIAAMMKALRETPPQQIDGSSVVEIMDCQSQEIYNLVSGEKRSTGLPKSNVLQFLTEDGSRITARPSGTEPKIKFYFSVRKQADQPDGRAILDELSQKIERIKKEIGV